MRVYVDGLFYKGTGIGRYYESMTKELAKIGLNIITSVPERLKEDFEKDFGGVSNIEPIFVDYEKFSIKGFYRHGKILKNLEKSVDLFFFPHINLPHYIPEKSIVTIHDIRPLTEWWDRNLIKREIFNYLLKRAIFRAKRVITVSHTTKTNLINYFKTQENKEKVRVIYTFIDDKFLNFEKPKNPLVKKNYILFVGNRKKHKNLRNLIYAFNEIKDKLNYKLVIAGSKDPGKETDEIDELIEKLHFSDLVIQYNSPSDEEILNLYSYAKLFVFPSFYEGFGLPPLEAIACGCPSITSNIPVLKEIYGEKIACFNPYSVDDMADKIFNILVDKEKRGNLLVEGRNRLKFFDKHRIINYIKLFDEVKRS